MLTSLRWQIPTFLAGISKLVSTWNTSPFSIYWLEYSLTTNAKPSPILASSRSRSWEPISISGDTLRPCVFRKPSTYSLDFRSEEHTSELQSRPHLVCRLLLEKKKNKI